MIQICRKCKKEFIPKYKNNIFCSRSCAATYNNKKRTLSDKTKRKISVSIRKTRATAIQTGTPVRQRKYYTKTCLNCEQQYKTIRPAQKYCCKQCIIKDEAYKEHLKQLAQERVKAGRHSGWKSRNIKSYAELFWEKVLINNCIEFKREDFSTKRYFLDFLLTKNGKKIDLEIDGKQHEYNDRKEHDRERDLFLRQNGFIVYRISWNSINTEKGKQEMSDKISKFLQFYNQI